MKKIFTLLFATVIFTLHAQDVSYGFRAGLNFSSLKGPLESSSTGGYTEKFGNTTGFHVGGAVNLKFTDQVSLKTELLYSQKGSRYSYNGKGFRIMTSETNHTTLATGTTHMALSISNSNIELPVSIAYRPVKSFEFVGGVYFSLMVGSKGTGDQSFSKGITQEGEVIDTIFQLLDYNYFSTKAPSTDAARTISIDNRGDLIKLPYTVGAYADIPKSTGYFFNRFDLGLQGGINFYMNQGLFLGVRFQYGLLDITNNKYDYSRSSSNGQARIPRSDFDRNVSWQASIGFNL